MLFFTCIRLVVQVLACAHAITHIKWIRLQHNSGFIKHTHIFRYTHNHTNTHITEGFHFHPWTFVSKTRSLAISITWYLIFKWVIKTHLKLKTALKININSASNKNSAGNSHLITTMPIQAVKVPSVAVTKLLL